MNDLLGYDEDGNPIWAMFGAEGDDTDDTDDGEEGGEDDDTEDEDDDAEGEGEKRPQPKSAKTKDKNQAAKKTSAYTPPSQREWEKTRAALKKANEAQAAQRKAALEKAKAEGMTEAAAKAREEAEAESTKTWHPRAVRAEARAMLAEAKCKNPTRLLKLIDTDAVTWEGNEPLGLEDQVTKLQEEWPELFSSDDEPKTKVKKEAPPAKKLGAAAGSSKKDEGDGKKDTRGAVKIASRLLGASA